MAYVWVKHAESKATAGPSPPRGAASALFDKDRDVELDRIASPVMGGEKELKEPLLGKGAERV